MELLIACRERFRFDASPFRDVIDFWLGIRQGTFNPISRGTH
jgi:hypothetical protein